MSLLFGPFADAFMLASHRFLEFSQLSLQRLHFYLDAVSLGSPLFGHGVKRALAKQSQNLCVRIVNILVDLSSEEDAVSLADFDHKI